MLLGHAQTAPKSQKLMWAGADGYIRAHMANGRAQMGTYEVQALLQAHSKSKELWKAMFHLDLV